MAQRRMFSLKIIDTDLFLDMSPTAQNLYFHLSMRADDDGFISNPNKIMRVVSCSKDDMRVLEAKQFVIPFESGICVIKHWKIHNYIQKDRYEKTIYIEEFRKLQEVDKQYLVNMDTKCIQNGDTGKVRDRLEIELGESKEREEINKENYSLKTEEEILGLAKQEELSLVPPVESQESEIIDYWEKTTKQNVRPNPVLTRGICKKIKEYGFTHVKSTIKFYQQIQENPKTWKGWKRGYSIFDFFNKSFDEYANNLHNENKFFSFEKESKPNRRKVKLT